MLLQLDDIAMYLTRKLAQLIFHRYDTETMTYAGHVYAGRCFRSVVEYANNIRFYVTAQAMHDNRVEMQERFQALLQEVDTADIQDCF